MMKDKEVEERPEPDILDVRTANEWIASSKNKPTPKMLFGDLWLEGELAILFADTGKGKSLLAVQIAESIARGFSIAPMEMTAKPQKVLYFDFELTAKQFEMRYAKERQDGESERLKDHYKFSNGFSRVEIKVNASMPKGYYTFETYIRHSIEKTVKETAATVLILDNITYLKRSNESTREAVPLMKELKRLKSVYGLSILVLAHTPKRDNSRPITVNDLQGSKVLSNFADNVFAIGQSKLDPAGRYIKHIKPRSTGLTYDGSNVLLFRLAKLNENFLGFQHVGFTAESVHLADAGGSREWDLIETIRSASDKGMTIRQIADELKMAKSHVHRLLKKWVPEKGRDDGGFDDEYPTSRREFDPTQHPYYFPGVEEYQALKEEIGFIEHLFKHDPESQKKVRQAWALEHAQAEARQIYLKTGRAPTLQESLAKLPEFAEYSSP